MFKNMGKFWFLTKSLFDPPYMGSEDFDHFRSFRWFGGTGRKSNVWSYLLYFGFCKSIIVYNPPVHPPDILRHPQTPSGHPPHTFETPSRHLEDYFSHKNDALLFADVPSGAGHVRLQNKGCVAAMTTQQFSDPSFVPLYLYEPE